MFLAVLHNAYVLGVLYLFSCCLLLTFQMFALSHFDVLFCTVSERIYHQMEYFSGQMKVTFGATLEDGRSEEEGGPSWGVDDLEISVL